jgi:hypothetical protein
MLRVCFPFVLHRGRSRLDPLEVFAMSTRTTETVVHFSLPFRLPDLDEIQPAGDYKIEQDEELIEGLSRLAYQRVATFIHLPAISADTRTRQVLKIDPNVLEKLLGAAAFQREGGAI